MISPILLKFLAMNKKSNKTPKGKPKIDELKSLEISSELHQLIRKNETQNKALQKIIESIRKAEKTN